MAAQITQVVSPLPDAPVEGAGFRARAAAFLSALVTFATQLIAWRSQVNAVAVAVNADATTSASAAQTASAAAQTAANAMSQMLAAVNADSVYPPQMVSSFYNPTSGLPSNPVVGQAHVALATANGWTAGHIYKRAATAWTDYAPTVDWLVLDVSTPAYFRWSGTAWVRQRTAYDISIGSNPDQVPINAQLGTAARLDQTWLYATATWDAPSCAAAAQVNTTMEVPGAAIGDRIVAPTASIPLQGLILRGEVTAANVVTLYLSNLTGAAVDLASASYYVSVLKRIPTR